MRRKSFERRNPVGGLDRSLLSTNGVFVFVELNSGYRNITIVLMGSGHIPLKVPSDEFNFDVCVHHVTSLALMSKT